ncbi:methyltransferase [Snodgrassella alvi]|uniref:site-specific DNA-methyltransferase (adenine-specific) n=1 Tax=Snodgrassella alvi TaxID=1196083 RepID=A0A2N9WTW2_9NEIS|nr:Eco57I restriction-modification methylase domain-containing protein [Snodgrassella alvi]PIT15117.1 methyltransferase [Snodgrassella alvi]
MNEAVIDDIRLKISSKLDQRNKSKFGQFMTASVIADYMASLFDKKNKRIKLLDCGAGIGSLSLSAIKVLKKIALVDLWEIDPVMREQLEKNMASIAAPFHIYSEDFVFDAVKNILFGYGERYTHAIINPPYKKISSNSEYRLELKKVGIETVNLYTAFLALSIHLMEKGGQIVAIIPRSFCNGPYYKPFRKLMLDQCSIEHIHLFKSRSKAFKDDNVLQEVIIIKLVKHQAQGDVKISQSTDHEFRDYDSKVVSFTEIIKPTDAELFVHIPIVKDIFENNPLFSVTLTELGLGVSTGPVVLHRMREFLVQTPNDSSVPLIFPHHFVKGEFQYPKEHKKPNAITVTTESVKWLMPNDGFYVIVKRFSAKEEKRRIVAYVINPAEIKTGMIGFENHWNVFHTKKHGFDQDIAMGLACFLNSTLFDNHFRVFSGHTQINATDLKNIRYPSIKILKSLGIAYKTNMDQKNIDQLVTETIL